MSFTYNLATDTGKVRLKLADTNSSAYAFEDAEIAYFLTEAGSVDAAVGMGARVLLADAARRQRAYSLPGITYDDKGRVEGLMALIRLYGSEMPTVGTVSTGTLPSDESFYTSGV